MNKKPVIQNLTAECSGNEKKIKAKGAPKNPSIEDIFRKTEYEKNLDNDNSTAPVEPACDTSFGFTDLKANNCGTSGLIVFVETNEMDDRRKAVRKEYKMNNPDA